MWQNRKTTLGREQNNTRTHALKCQKSQVIVFYHATATLGLGVPTYGSTLLRSHGKYANERGRWGERACSSIHHVHARATCAGMASRLLNKGRARLVRRDRITIRSQEMARHASGAPVPP